MDDFFDNKGDASNDSSSWFNDSASIKTDDDSGAWFGDDGSADVPDMEDDSTGWSGDDGSEDVSEYDAKAEPFSKPAVEDVPAFFADPAPFSKADGDAPFSQAEFDTANVVAASDTVALDDPGEPVSDSVAADTALRDDPDEPLSAPPDSDEPPFVTAEVVAKPMTEARMVNTPEASHDSEVITAQDDGTTVREPAVDGRELEPVSNPPGDMPQPVSEPLAAPPNDVASFAPDETAIAPEADQLPFASSDESVSAAFAETKIVLDGANVSSDAADSIGRVVENAPVVPDDNSLSLDKDTAVSDAASVTEAEVSEAATAQVLQNEPVADTITAEADTLAATSVLDAAQTAQSDATVTPQDDLLAVVNKSNDAMPPDDAGADTDVPSVKGEIYSYGSPDDTVTRFFPENPADMKSLTADQVAQVTGQKVIAKGDLGFVLENPAFPTDTPTGSFDGQTDQNYSVWKPSDDFARQKKEIDTTQAEPDANAAQNTDTATLDAPEPPAPSDIPKTPVEPKAGLGEKIHDWGIRTTAIGAMTLQGGANLLGLGPNLLPPVYRESPSIVGQQYLVSAQDEQGIETASSPVDAPTEPDNGSTEDKRREALAAVLNDTGSDMADATRVQGEHEEAIERAKDMEGSDRKHQEVDVGDPPKKKQP